MKVKIGIILLFFLCLFQLVNAFETEKAIIKDSSHYSSIFGEIRNYRIFLPPGYYEYPEKRYPVIYYYHGWSQRYFGSIREMGADEGNSNDGDNIANFVSKNEVIVVKPDGYNRTINEEYYLRPYNISPVETYRQFPLYFPEIVKHVDENYRTIADRGHRAISGLSMGGFMTFWIAGKYPHLVSAAGNFCGSTEFVVGPKEFPVEYRHQDMYKNYNGVNVRLNYGDKDFIRAYHKDMNKIWTQLLDNYEYKIYNAGHSTCGMGEMFNFLLKTFENPPEKPSKWNHIDVYPKFSVWGYQVNSNRNVPGFTIIENVDKRGFKSSIKTFLPDGELLPFVNLTVTTPPVYEKNQFYQIHDINPLDGESSEYAIKSNGDGQLNIKLSGDIHEIGINKKEDPANIVVASFQIENTDWATHGKKIDVSIKLLNKGVGLANNVTAKLEAARANAVILNNQSKFGNIEKGKIINSKETFTFLVEDETVEIERFKLTINDDNENIWYDFIDVPVMVDGPRIKDIIIADGKEYKVAEAGDDTVSVFLGNGNGDGEANPGESIVILVKDNGRLFRTQSYTSNPYVNPGGIHIRKSDKWSSYDHVGASSKYSVPLLASNCPSNHTIKFFVEYWLPAYPDHIIKRGIVYINVKGTDKTPPGLQWINMLSSNTVQAKLYDGGGISSVKVKFRSKDDPEKSFEVELNDQGMAGDYSKGDRVYSKKIEEKGFGLYRIAIEASDDHGNATVKDWPGIVTVY